ncbi:DNA topoisomerase III [Taylorella equigenitalis]|uniref:DNA topoisomerase III n=1 Tax=Taylorella equigenitalis TaxID=29575 RepID=UPI00040E7440|nr:DNA topoisomerase III [Taylorella equigenitalis]WDU47892.1 DNA topoisomerase III [Taylorella equigenitalis]
MSKTLVIAEKPSVATDLSKALGTFKKETGFYENDHYVISSSVGHLLTLFNPDDAVRGKWSFTNLPAIPSKKFEIQPIDKKSKERLSLLVKLIKRADIELIINACDAGREGELIFRYIMQYAKVKKPIKRLWLQSMTKQAIQEAFENLRSDESMKPLEDSARSRAEADWLIGINGTRAMTAFNSKGGGFNKTPIGRVQTPTLAIVYDRDQKIRAYEPKDYWEVVATFVASAGVYEGKWFDPEFKKNPKDPDARESRLWDANTAKTIVLACKGKEGTVTEETKENTQNSPILFDLTTLQREANSKFGYSAKTTLALAQALYEKHKLITYPRTDSRYLPEDYLNTVKENIKAMSSDSSSLHTGHKEFAQKIISNKWVKSNKRIFNNSKVSDHFAIIPTSNSTATLSEAEFKVYDLICKRFMAVFYPPAIYNVTTRITEVISYKFKTEGKILVSPGWLEIYGREEMDETLPPIKANETVLTESIESIQNKTKPPAHFNEATLLSAMEGAGKLVDSDDLREAMSERGLGTPATRASIIEGLISEQYLRREGKDLITTIKTKQLMTLLHGLSINELTSPELTGEWEYKLRQIEEGNLDRNKFMQEIAKNTQIIVKRAKEYEHDTVPGDYATLETPCPVCGGVIKENYRRYACTDCDFSITKNPGSRPFETAEVEEFLTNRSIGPLSGFISKMGRPFAAILKLTDDNKLEFDFGNDNAQEKEDIDLTALEPVGKCPKCSSNVYDTGLNYACEKQIKDKSCDFKSGKVILQQEIPLEQMQKLLSNGRTDLLEKFISNRTKRAFKAYLVLEKNGNVGFEFEKKSSTGRKSSKK